MIDLFSCYIKSLQNCQKFFCLRLEAQCFVCHEKHKENVAKSKDEMAMAAMAAVTDSAKCFC